MKSLRFTLCAPATVAALLILLPAAGARAAVDPHQHAAINCSNAAAMCTEVGNSSDVFGHYVGRDEPSMLFDSDVAGSGNHMSYGVTLPTDPSASDPTAPGKSYQFELSGADWFGMAICDTQSYPEQVRRATTAQRQRRGRPPPRPSIARPAAP
jgi:hypothetical protein